MAILLALLSALCWGAADFAGGLGSRELGAPRVAVATQTLALITAGIAVLLFPGVGPKPAALEWGALSGLGSGIGTLSLYHGLATGRMTVVATLSGVLAAVVPVIVGLALGNTLGLAATAHPGPARLGASGGPARAAGALAPGARAAEGSRAHAERRDPQRPGQSPVPGRHWAR
jgi:uncharacterized membrane protein